MCFPSGDQATNEGASEAGAATYRTFSSLPFALVVINSYLPSSGLFIRAKAMRRPSGENVMSLSIPRTTVIGVPPSTGVRYRSKFVFVESTALMK